MRPARLPGGQVVQRVPFDQTYLEHSAVWLQDAELVWLIRSATSFDAEGQRAWFDGLSARSDYAIWGLACDGRPVGVIGIKDIGVDDGALYFMYVGERSHWRLGIGRWALLEIQAEIGSRGLRWVYGRIAQHNTRSRQAHFALGMLPLREELDETVVRIGVDDPVG